jgi:hypothetical protein
MNLSLDTFCFIEGWGPLGEERRKEASYHKLKNKYPMVSNRKKDRKKNRMVYQNFKIKSTVIGCFKTVHTQI